MANRVVIFPVGKAAAAETYRAGVNAHYASAFEPGGQFAYLREDAEGQWVVPYYGPPWRFDGSQMFEEPDECVALRVEGVLHDHAVWAEED